MCWKNESFLVYYFVSKNTFSYLHESSPAKIHFKVSSKSTIKTLEKGVNYVQR